LIGELSFCACSSPPIALSGELLQLSLGCVSVLFNAEVPGTLKAFRSYFSAFDKLAARFRECKGTQDSDPLEVVKTNKRLDNALFAFGQFLAAYDR